MGAGGVYYPGPLGGMLVWLLRPLQGSTSPPTVAIATRRPPRQSAESSSSLETLPRPATTLPLLGNTLDVLRLGDSFAKWVCGTTRLVGGRLWLLQTLGRAPTVVVSSPELIEDVQRAQFAKFGVLSGSDDDDGLSKLFGAGLSAADSRRWRMQHKALAAALGSLEMRDTMLQIVESHSMVLETVLEATEVVDVKKLLRLFATEVLVDMAVGVELGQLKTQSPSGLQRAMDAVVAAVANRQLLPPFVWKLLRLLNVGSEAVLASNAVAMRQEMDRLLSHSLAARHRRPTLVRMLMAHRPSTSPFASELLRDMVLNVVLSGRDAMADTMAAFLVCMATHSEVQARVHAEVAGLGTDITSETLARLVYLEAAVKETLRLYPPHPLVRRFALEDVKLADSTRLPRGTCVVMVAAALARRTDVWGMDAAHFRPERWIVDEDSGPRLRRVSNFQFNALLAGPRACPGASIAMPQLKLVLARVLSRLSVAVPSTGSHWIGQGANLHPHLLRFERREHKVHPEADEPHAIAA